MKELGRGAWQTDDGIWVLTMQLRMTAQFPMGIEEPGAFDMVWHIRCMELPGGRYDRVFESKDEALEVMAQLDT